MRDSEVSTGLLLLTNSSERHCGITSFGCAGSPPMRVTAIGAHKRSNQASALRESTSGIPKGRRGKELSILDFISFAWEALRRR
jgi:hypothetical protein